MRFCFLEMLEEGLEVEREVWILYLMFRRAQSRLRFKRGMARDSKLNPGKWS